MRSSLKGDAAACLLMAVVIAYGPQARVGVPAVAAFFAGSLLERHRPHVPLHPAIDVVVRTQREQQTW